MNIEYITVPMEIKALQADQFEGYGSTFGNVDLGGDVVMKGAFKESLEQYRANDEWPQMFWMHRPDLIPGRWLDMAEDSKGLKVKGESLPTSIGNDVKVLMKAKAVRRMSIGFSIDSPDDYEFKDGVRLIHKINLWEVSPVSLAMNPKAKINAVKALLHERGMCLTEFKRELEHWLREQGLSKSQSRSVAGRALAPDDFPEFEFGEMPNSVDDGDKSGVMPDESRRDTDEDAQAALAVQALADKMLAATVRRPRL